MSDPLLLVLPAEIKEVTWDRSTHRLVHARTRLFDANGTEFVGISQVSSSDDPHAPDRTIITITMSLKRDEIQVIDAPPGARK